MALQDKRAFFQVIGSLMRKPSLLEESEYMLNRDDFPEPFHKVIFACINNLYAEGVEVIDSIAIDNYLAQYDQQHKLFNDNSGMDYLHEAVNNASVENCDYNIVRIKKFSMLREYQSNGIDISDIYNEKIVSPKKQEEMQEKFDKMSLEELSNAVEKKLEDVRDKFLKSVNGFGQQAGAGLKQLKEGFKTTPEIGSPLCSGYFNTIFRGARLRKVYLRSAPTGIGKCFLGKTLINTNKGLIRIDEIPKYFDVNSKNESVSQIVSYNIETGEKLLLPTSHWYDMGKSQTIKIKTSQGYDFEGTPEHPIVVGDKYGDTYFKKLKDITKEDMVIMSLGSDLFGENEMPLDLSYLLGFLTGDGYLKIENNLQKNRTSLSYSKKVKSIYTQVNEMIQKEMIGVSIVKPHKHDSGINHSFGNQQTIDFLQNECDLTMNTAKHKKVPQTVMMGTKEMVVSFLQGLFDTDGSITNKMFEYSTASERLAEQVHVLLLNFGIISNRRIKKVGGESYHIISICNQPMLQQFKKEIGFKLATPKQEKLEQLTKKSNNINSNIDFAYGERLELLHVYLKENFSEYKYNRKKSLSYQFNGLTFYESMKNGRRISRERIKSIMKYISYTGLSELEYLRNSVNNMFFDAIDSIETGEENVYDFTVPVTHCFVANGTISHNTRLSLGDATNLAVDEIYDTDKRCWVTNGISEPTLFITTELEIDEVQTPMIAFVSGVQEEVILDGNYTGDEEKRVNRAIEIIERSPLHIEYMPDFDVAEIERKIKKYIRNHGVKYIFFDYIHVSIQMLEELASQSKGMKLREDNVLLMFITRLKNICNKHGVFLFTSTQVNSDYKNVQNGDQNLLRGAKSIADKIDGGIIALEPTKADKEAIAHIMMGRFDIEPNIVFHVYKNRRGKWNKVKVWCYADLGTCRFRDMFVTDSEYRLISIQPTDIERKIVDTNF